MNSLDSAGKTFVGFGFGPIQSGLFLYEAHVSGNFHRFVVAEVDQAVVDAVRANGGSFSINIAGKSQIIQATVDNVEIYNPTNADDRQSLVRAISSADEMATCLPSVSLFDRGAETSPARILAEGLSRRRAAFPTIIYAAENHNHAAELLQESIARHCPDTALESVQILNTVIGKMSGGVTDTAQIQAQALVPLAPSIPRAVLVEEFNRILISRIALPGFKRGIRAFIEKDDLLPFEEAKLYGHNAVHALIGYLANARGLAYMADAGCNPAIMDIARRAFLDESGAALIKKHHALGDPLFTPDGYRQYAEDLLDRMSRPTLNDQVARICRDPIRKLGLDDRLYGTMRVVLSQGIQPLNMALGAAAALRMLASSGERPDLPRDPAALDAATVRAFLTSFWNAPDEPHVDALIALTVAALERLNA